MENRILKRLCLTIVCISLMAVMISVKPVQSQRLYGPRMDTLRQKVTRSPAAQLLEMQAELTGSTVGSDIWQGLIRPSDIEDMQARALTVSSRGGFHYCQIGMNYREPPLDDVNYRHALAHLIPKDRIIGSLFRYIVVKVNTPVPPAQAQWYNGAVDPHPYGSAEAERILGNLSGRYRRVGGVWQYADGRTLETLRFFTPLEVTAPTSFTIGRMVVEECQKIGLMNIEQVPMDFATYLDLVYNKWDYELFWVCYGLGRNPTHLWDLFNSINNFKGSSNPYGINSALIDAATNDLYFNLDAEVQVAGAVLAQELLMGGTTLNPLPDYLPPGDPRDQALPVYAVYSRNYYDIQRPLLKGSVNMFGYGTDNGWTYMNAYWDTAGNVRPYPGSTEKTLVRVEDEFPERLNPLFATTVYANDFMSNTQDGLIAVNPYTHGDVDWLAKWWDYYAVPGGMDVKFDLRFSEAGQTVMFQDKDPVAWTDAQFSWDFLHDWAIPNYWSAFRYYDGTTHPFGNDTIVVRMTQASRWHVYSLAGTAYMLPPQVWDRPWADLPTILGYDPSAEAYPDPDGGGPLTALPTKLWGTGPWINQHSTAVIGTAGYGDLLANGNYWLSTAGIEDKIEYMFWRAGDVNRLGEVDGTDISDIAYSYDSYIYPHCDITGAAGTPPDSWVDIYDLATAGKFFGEKRTVPFP